MSEPIETVNVFDTWVRSPSGRMSHFDVMTTDEVTAARLATEYLARIGEPQVPVTTKECRFCHREPTVMFSASQQQELREQGGFIVRLDP